MTGLDHRRTRISHALAILLLGVALTVNPVTIGHLTRTTGRIETTWIRAGFWLCCMLSIAASATMVFGSPAARTRLAGWLVQGSFVMTSSIVAFFLLDPMVGALKPHSFDVRSFEFGYHVQLNSLGYRSHEFQRSKTPGVLRIFVIGDSFTFGAAVPQEVTIPALIQQQLGPAFDVWNLGHFDADTYDYLAIARQFRNYAPDEIVLDLYVDNDVSPARQPPLRQWIRARNLFRPVYSAVRFLVDRPFDSYRGVSPEIVRLTEQHLMNPMLLRRGAEGDNQTYYDRMTRQFEELPYTRENLLAIHKLFPNTPFLLVLIPSKIQVGTSYFAGMRELGWTFDRDSVVSDGLQRSISKWATREGIGVIDLLPDAQRDPNRDSLYFRTDDHFNTKGNRLAAKAIGKGVRSMLGKEAGRTVTAHSLVRRVPLG